MEIFFISDLHLNQDNLSSYNLLVKFLSNLPSQTKAIYILGDLFEFWIDDNLNDPFSLQVKQLLKKTTEKFPIYIIKGNRDFLLGNKFAAETGTTILADLVTLDLYENKILLMHGDYLCTNDLTHLYFTKIIRHPISIFILNMLPIWLKLILAKMLRKLSIKKQKLKKSQDMKTTDHNYKNTAYDVSLNTVKNLMQQYSAKILIHGHTHKPNIYHFSNEYKNSSKELIRIVLGDWHDTAKILELTPLGYQLKDISI